MLLFAECWWLPVRVLHQCQAISLVLSLVLSNLVYPSMQVAEFIHEPAPYYYTLPGDVTEINCLAVEMRPDDSQINLNATFFRNSIPINIYYPPPRHLVLNSQENIIGILITPTLLEDSLAEYHCTVGDLTSLRSILYVGDGLPLKLEYAPVQLLETLYSITIDWGSSPAPAHAPILGYNITLRPVYPSWAAAIVIETNDNETQVELTRLTPGFNYSVTVGGYNSVGLGPLSPVVYVSTMMAVVPPAPAYVQARVEQRVVNVTWQGVEIDFNTMTPLIDYLVRYGRKGSTPEIMATMDNVTTHYILFSDNGENLEVGVASRNSAGYSQFTSIVVSAEVERNGVGIVVVILVVSVVSAFLLVLLVLFIICFICYKTQALSYPSNLSEEQDSDKGSPSSSKKSLQNEQKSPSELQEYSSEPRRLYKLNNLIKPSSGELHVLHAGHTTFR